MEDIKKVTTSTTVKRAAPKAAAKTSPVKKSAPKSTAKKVTKSVKAKTPAKKKEPAKIVEWTKNTAIPAVGNAFRATGRGIGHAFMEMSDSLAGWVDETSKPFKKEQQPAKKMTKKTTAKKVTTRTAKK